MFIESLLMKGKFMKILSMAIEAGKITIYIKLSISICEVHYLDYEHKTL